MFRDIRSCRGVELLLSLFVVGCSSSSSNAAASDDAAAPEVGTDAAADAGEDVAGATIAITTPSSPTYAASTPVPVQVTMTGPIAERVDVQLDGATIAVLESPFTYVLDPTPLKEGTHALVANGHFGTTTLASAPVTLIVDRTPPTIATRAPGPGEPSAHVADPIVVGFSEPVLASSVGGGAVTLTNAGVPVACTSSLSADGKTLTITPLVPTDGGSSTLAITVASTITDLAGNALAGGPNAWSWQPPAWLTYAGPPLATYPLASGPSPYLALQPQWQLGRDGTMLFEVDGEWLGPPGSVPVAPSHLYRRKGGVWAEIAMPAPPTTPKDYAIGSTSWTLDDAGAIVATAVAYDATATSPGLEKWLATARWSGSSWSAFAQDTASYDATYGYYAVDSAGNAYALVSTSDGGGQSWFKRTGGVWAAWASVPAVTGTFVQARMRDGSLYVLRMSGTASNASPNAHVTLTKFDGSSWSTLADARIGFAGSAPIPMCTPSFAPDGTPRIACYVVQGPPSPVGDAYPPADAFVYRPGAFGWDMVGGGPIGPKVMFLWPGFATYPTLVDDRFGRTHAVLWGTDLTSGAVMVDLANDQWQKPIVAPLPASGALSDCAYGLSGFASDFAGNDAFVETHGAADATGTTLTPVATIHLSNR